MFELFGLGKGTLTFALGAILSVGAEATPLFMTLLKFFRSRDSSMLRHPTHLQLLEQAIFAWKEIFPRSNALKYSIWKKKVFNIGEIRKDLQRFDFIWIQNFRRDPSIFFQQFAWKFFWNMRESGILLNKSSFQNFQIFAWNF